MIVDIILSVIFLDTAFPRSAAVLLRITIMAMIASNTPTMIEPILSGKVLFV